MRVCEERGLYTVELSGEVFGGDDLTWDRSPGQDEAFVPSASSASSASSTLFALAFHALDVPAAAFESSDTRERHKAIVLKRVLFDQAGVQSDCAVFGLLVSFPLLPDALVPNTSCEIKRCRGMTALWVILLDGQQLGECFVVLSVFVGFVCESPAGHDSHLAAWILLL